MDTRTLFQTEELMATENQKVRNFAACALVAGFAFEKFSIDPVQAQRCGFWIFLIGTAIIYYSIYLLIPAARRQFINGSFFKFLKKIAG